MAKRKSEIVVQNWITKDALEVTCDTDMVDRIKDVEGVTMVDNADWMNRSVVWLDARYDRDEIADEIRALTS